MAILTHGSDLSLAPTIRPIVRQNGGTVREALERLSDAGFTRVQLDAALPGVRPRDLDQRARRDLLALLARRGVGVGGVDLFIPRRHYVEAEHVDRAMAATLAAIVLAADLGRVPLSLALPVRQLSEDARKALVEAADGHGVRLAVHAEDQLDELLAWVAEVDLYVLAAALDPAAFLARGQDPASIVTRLGKRLAVARLSDISGGAEGGDDAAAVGDIASGVRCAVGEGDLDVVGYRVALDLAAGRTGPVVLDLRGLENALAGAARAARVWSKAAFTV